MTETNAYVCSVAGGDYLERVSCAVLVFPRTPEADREAGEYRSTSPYL